MGRHQRHRKPWGGRNKNGHGRNFDGDRHGKFTFHCGGGGTFHQRAFSSRPGKVAPSVMNYANTYPLGAVGGYESTAHGAIGATSCSQHQQRCEGRGQGRWHKRAGKGRGRGAGAKAAGRVDARGGDKTTQRESSEVSIKRKDQAHDMLGQANRRNEAGGSCTLPSVPLSYGGSVKTSMSTGPSAAAASNEPERNEECGAVATKEGTVDTSKETGVVMEGLARRAEKEIGLPEEDQELCSERQIRPHLMWHRVCKIGPGFTNLGNTCFLNAILQCLSYLPPLAQHLLDGRYSQDSGEGASTSTPATAGHPNLGNNDVIGAMHRLIEQVHRAGPSATKQTVSPTFFSHNIRLIGDRFRKGRQEDAHEFLRHLLDRMAGDCLQRRGVKTFASNKVAETTPIHRVFGGYLRSQLKCTCCRHFSRKYDTFMDLSLDLEKMSPDGSTKRFRSLHAALKSFTATETLGSGNEWKCGGCEKLVEAEKTLSVFKPPNALVVQLKRFGFTGTTAKIRDHVHFEEKLNLDVSGPERRVGYDLTGVVVHCGISMACGHYVAYVRSSDGWAKMNDKVVTQVKLDTVLKDEAYVLFYKRRPASLSLVASPSVTSPPPPSLPSRTAAGANDSSLAGEDGDQPTPCESKRGRKRRRKQERAAASAAAAAAVTTPAAPAAATTAATARAAGSSAEAAAEAASAGAIAATAASASGSARVPAAATKTASNTTVAVTADNDEPDESPRSKKPRVSGNTEAAENTKQSAGVVKIPPTRHALIPECAGRGDDDPSADRLGGESGRKNAAEQDSVGQGAGATPRVVSPSTSPPLPSVVKIPSDALPGAVTGKRSREVGASAEIGARNAKLRRLQSRNLSVESPGSISSASSAPGVVEPLAGAKSGTVTGERPKVDGTPPQTEADTSGLPGTTREAQRVSGADRIKPRDSPSMPPIPPSNVHPLSDPVSGAVTGKPPRENGTRTPTEAGASGLPGRIPKGQSVDGGNGIKPPASPSTPGTPPSVVRPLSKAVSGAVAGKRPREDEAPAQTEADAGGPPSENPTTPRRQGDNGGVRVGIRVEADTPRLAKKRRGPST